MHSSLIIDLATLYIEQPVAKHQIKFLRGVVNAQ